MLKCKKTFNTETLLIYQNGGLQFGNNESTID